MQFKIVAGIEKIKFIITLAEDETVKFCSISMKAFEVTFTPTLKLFFAALPAVASLLGLRTLLGAIFVVEPAFALRCL